MKIRESAFMTPQQVPILTLRPLGDIAFRDHYLPYEGVPRNRWPLGEGYVLPKHRLQSNEILSGPGPWVAS